MDTLKRHLDEGGRGPVDEELTTLYRAASAHLKSGARAYAETVGAARRPILLGDVLIGRTYDVRRAHLDSDLARRRGRALSCSFLDGATIPAFRPRERWTGPARGGRRRRIVRRSALLVRATAMRAASSPFGPRGRSVRVRPVLRGRSARRRLRGGGHASTLQTRSRTAEHLRRTCRLQQLEVRLAADRRATWPPKPKPATHG